MENFFQNLKTKVKETLSPGRGVSEAERNPNEPPNPTVTPPELNFIDGGSREVKWIKYRPAMNIFSRVLVHHHNKKENANLKFEEVVKAEFRCCPGMHYHITLKAKDGENVNVYETGIGLVAWNKWKEMLSLGELSLVYDAPSLSSAKSNC